MREDLTNRPTEEEQRAPRLIAAWLNAIHADLMLHHLAITGPKWPEANLYCHSCISALRSVTFMMQKALSHEPGFADWYARVRDCLSNDREYAYLKDARNYVLHEGGLELLASVEISYSGGLPIQIRSIGPDGPDVWIRRGEDEPVPVDWRRLDGFNFRVPMRLAPISELPNPPERELLELLRDAVLRLRLILHEAEARFDPENADAHQAQLDEAERGRPWTAA